MQEEIKKLKFPTGHKVIPSEDAFGKKIKILGWKSDGHVAI